MPGDVRFPVHFDEEAFDADLLHLTPRGRSSAIQFRAELAERGIPAARLMRCQDIGVDGTRLGGCVKAYHPNASDGTWGAVLRLRRSDADRLQLLVVAFGERHPTAAWRPSVYQLADQRLHP